jgi:hypothetical protein
MTNEEIINALEQKTWERLLFEADGNVARANEAMLHLLAKGLVKLSETHGDAFVIERANHYLRTRDIQLELIRSPQTGQLEVILNQPATKAPD